MKKALLTIFAISSFAITTAFSQSETLFTVGDTKVKKSEFEYIYKKNNFSNKADFSKKSLDDYLNLYVNFRLKVKEAMAQGLDTGSRFKEELTVYEKQLLESYVEKDVLDKLVKQEFERSKTDVQL
ncbi:MAG: peptidylprolyl isomerase, partial [Chitinophagales bacterium]|nr:peptidylprolyl isomerase [Chitinophagales bacterium]